MAKRAVYFQFSGYDGKDIWLAFLPKKWQIKMIAKAWLKDLRNPDVNETPCIIQTSWGAFRIVDSKGNTVPCVNDSKSQF